MRLDILIYAHDGRGLGHVSRSLGICMALRRLYPHLKILFISGSTFTGELLGGAPVDWLKLPSYKTRVVEGTSRGVHGDSMFSDPELGELRQDELAHVVKLYKPRLVLVDHTPQGKHKELLSALKVCPHDCQWVLGVRGVVGAVPQAKEEFTRDLFQKYYSGLLWYGDSTVLGEKHVDALKQQYKIDPFRCGYVARLGEYLQTNRTSVKKNTQWAGIVSVPWRGENTGDVLESLAVALLNIGPSYGQWCLFIATDNEIQRTERDALFSGVTHCTLRNPGGNYGEELMRSQCAVVYGGYNSIVDVLYAQIPALVILREMKDQEQQDHVARLQGTVKTGLTEVFETRINADLLQKILLQKLKGPARTDYGIKVNGAEKAARYLYRKIQAG